MCSFFFFTVDVGFLISSWLIFSVEKAGWGDWYFGWHLMGKVFGKFYSYPALNAPPHFLLGCAPQKHREGYTKIQQFWVWLLIIWGFCLIRKVNWWLAFLWLERKDVLRLVLQLFTLPPALSTSPSLCCSHIWTLFSADAHFDPRLQLLSQQARWWWTVKHLHPIGFRFTEIVTSDLQNVLLRNSPFTTCESASYQFPAGCKPAEQICLQSVNLHR